MVHLEAGNTVPSAKDTSDFVVTTLPLLRLPGHVAKALLGVLAPAAQAWRRPINWPMQRTSGLRRPEAGPLWALARPPPSQMIGLYVKWKMVSSELSRHRMHPETEDNIVSAHRKSVPLELQWPDLSCKPKRVGDDGGAEADENRNVGAAAFAAALLSCSVVLPVAMVVVAVVVVAQQHCCCCCRHHCRK